MKVLKRVVAVVGIALGVGSLLCAAGWWLFVSRGPFPSGVIHTEQAEIPFVWYGEMRWQDYAIVAGLAVLGVALIITSFRFGFRRRAELCAALNGGSAERLGDSGVNGGPPSVS